MSEPDLTLAILRDIRDEIRTTRVELKTEISAVRTELKTEISAVRTELKSELVEVRAELVVVGETIKDLAGQMLILTCYVKNVADRHDTSIEDLRTRVERLEATR